MAQADGLALQQTLLQQLRGLRRAGVTHLPPASQPTDPDLSSAQPTDAGMNASSPPATGDSQQQLDQLRDCVAACTRCRELADQRTQTVFGVGDANARVLFVGEAPGADEDRQGIPFVGRAGQLLDKIIEASQLKRSEIYICNILKCRPPGNRNPLPDEADACREYLDGQIAAVNPEYIVCWGAVAAQNLLDTTVSIGKLRGTFHEHAGAKVLCTYHPSYLLRNPSMKKKVWEDMQLLMAELGLSVN